MRRQVATHAGHHVRGGRVPRPAATVSPPVAGKPAAAQNIDNLMTDLFRMTSRNNAVKREPTVRKTHSLKKDKTTTSKNSLKAVLMGIFDVWYSGKFGQKVPNSNGIRERPHHTGATVTQTRSQQPLTPKLKVRRRQGTSLQGATVTQTRSQQPLTPRLKVRERQGTTLHGAERRTHAPQRQSVEGPATLQRNLQKQQLRGVTSRRQHVAPKSEPGGQRLKLYNVESPSLVAPRPRIAPKPKPQVRRQRIQLFTGLSPKLLQSATKPKVPEQRRRLFQGMMPPAPPQPAPARAKTVSFWSGLQTQTIKPLKPAREQSNVQHVVAIRRPRVTKTTVPVPLPPVFTAAPQPPQIFTAAPQPPQIFTTAPQPPPIFTAAPKPPPIFTVPKPVQQEVGPKQYMASAPSASTVSNAITTKIAAMLSATKAALALAAKKAGIVPVTQSAAAVTAPKPVPTAAVTAKKAATETAKIVSAKKAPTEMTKQVTLKKAAKTAAAKATTAAPATTTTAPADNAKSYVSSNVTANAMSNVTADNVTGSSAHMGNATSNVTATAFSKVTAKQVIVFSDIAGNVKSGITYDIIANNVIAISAPSSNVTSNAKSEVMTKTDNVYKTSKNNLAPNVATNATAVLEHTNNAMPNTNITVILAQRSNVTSNATPITKSDASANNVTDMSAPTYNSTTTIIGNNATMPAHMGNLTSKDTSNTTSDVITNNVTAFSEQSGNITLNVTSKATSNIKPNVTANNVTAISAHTGNVTSNVTLNATSNTTANVTSNVTAISALTGNSTAANASSTNVTASNATAANVTAANATAANVTTANATAANATANNATADNGTAAMIPAEAIETTTVALEIATIDPEVLAEMNEGRVNQGLRPLLLHEVDANGNTLPPPTVPPSIMFLAGGHGHGHGHGHGPINHGHGNNRRHEGVHNAHDHLHSQKRGRSGGNMMNSIHNTHLAAHLQSGPMTAAQHRNLHSFLERWGHHAVRPIPTTTPPMHYLQQLDPDLYQDYLELKRAQKAAAGR